MRLIKVKFNQQQLELIDRAVAEGLAADRSSLIRKALREHAARSTAAANGRQKP